MPNISATYDVVIDDLYAGVLDDEAWSRAMIVAADLVRATCTCLLSIRPIDGAVLRDQVFRYDSALFARYRLSWINKDPRLLPTMRCGVGEAMYERKLLPINSWKRSEIYNEYLLPAETPWFLAFWLHKASDKIVTLSFQGSKRRGSFGEADGSRIKPLLPMYVVHSS